MPTPHTLSAQRAVDGIDLTWAVTLDGITFLWAGLNTPTWWRTVAMTDEFRAMEVDGYRLMLHPSTNTVLVELAPSDPTKDTGG